MSNRFFFFSFTESVRHFLDTLSDKIRDRFVDGPLFKHCNILHVYFHLETKKKRNCLLVLAVL